jgi:hypothetical protein
MEDFLWLSSDAGPDDPMYREGGPKPLQGGATWHGCVPDTDPRYKSGWNYLCGKNLNQHFKERSADAAQGEALVEPEKREDR